MRPANVGPIIMRKSVSTVGHMLLGASAVAASAFVVEEVIDPLRQFSAHAVYQFQFSQRRARHTSRRAEAIEQSALSRWPHPIDLVERILGGARLALAAMRPDREPVRLVAQALQVVEDRAFLVEPERRTARNEEA